jgi:hypothetical protein
MASSSSETFAASKIWFDKFQKRDAGSGEQVATHDFADESFSPHKPQELFNLDETSLLELM